MFQGFNVWLINWDYYFRSFWPSYWHLLLIIISCMNKITCIFDPCPTRLLMSHLQESIPILQHIVNICLTPGDFPISRKSSIVIHLIKQPSLDWEIFTNYSPVSNRSFLSTVIEKVISIRILGHILDKNIVESFQSVYKAGHSRDWRHMLEYAVTHYD